MDQAAAAEARASVQPNDWMYLMVNCTSDEAHPGSWRVKVSVRMMGIKQWDAQWFISEWVPQEHIVGAIGLACGAFRVAGDRRRETWAALVGDHLDRLEDAPF